MTKSGATGNTLTVRRTRVRVCAAGAQVVAPVNNCVYRVARNCVHRWVPLAGVDVSVLHMKSGVHAVTPASVDIASLGAYA